MSHRKIFLAGLCCVFLLPTLVNASINSLYGKVKIEHPLVRKLLGHPAVKRMRAIDNAGPSRYFRSLPVYSLFDHAVGVFVILKRFGLPFEEQIAGLLEPVAHSVFSHQGTLYLRPKGSKLPYYLATQQAFIKKSQIEGVLQQFQMTAGAVHPKLPKYTSIVKDPPQVSAIEIEMALRLAYSYKLLSRKDVSSIMSDLRFKNGKWFFITHKSARRLARLSLYFSERYWGSPTSYVINRWVAAALKRAVDLGILNLKQLRFGVDQDVLARLMRSKDKFVKGMLLRCRQPFRFHEVVTTGRFDELYKPEFRGMDPLVEVGGKLKRLSELDSGFKREFQALKSRFDKGIKIRYRKPKKRGRMNHFSKAGVDDVSVIEVD